ncbi:MAG: phenylalanyl-tRNA synthetase alpha chain [Chloroflexota bacterium]|nr:phenylalanyl-tRNA synthetase alpha chain [Chloroflexota bacterium]
MSLADLTRDLEALRDDALAAIAAAPDPAALQALEVDILGKKGRLTAVSRGIGALPAEDRPRVGALANPVRTAIEAAFRERAEVLGADALRARLAAEAIDVTTPGRPIARGARHPSIEGMAEIAEIFGRFGFVVHESPEIEDDVTNFQKLNIPPDHPARDLWDTLYVDLPGHLLRTHTSPGQIRVMESSRPPIRALLPGRCFRYEAVDASHGFEFFQVEGLMVDEGTTMGDLRGLLDAFAHAMFGAGRKTRFRPGYYPFTEPSVAFDVECLVCGGGGCPACGRTGWMTILGAGMVHPVVLRNGGLDPERYQGFAFGMGPERIKMLKHGITDLRLFMDNDLRFLEQFR